MILPYSWLQAFAKTPLPAPLELAEKLNLAGIETEVQPLLSAPLSQDIVTARVVSSEPHPHADRLQVCQVDVAQAQPLQIVCGAPNVRTGLTVACALVGSTLPSQLIIRPVKLRKVESLGMLCAADELNLSFWPHLQGIMELADDAPIGIALAAYLDLSTDFLLDIKVTPNRADCLSVLGIVRELCTLDSHQQLLYKTPPGLPCSVPVSRTVHIQTPSACQQCYYQEIRNLKIPKHLPSAIDIALRKSGIRRVSPIVDITQYAMLELGQPLHAYDLDTICGDLHIQYASPGESLTLIDQSTLHLDSSHQNILMVRDSQKSIAVAGVMGCQNTAISEHTQHILLESAAFNPEAILGTSQRLKVHSDAAYRFERGIDPDQVAAALARACTLILNICQGDLGDGFSSSIAPPDRTPITLRLSRLNALLGTAFEATTVQQIFNQLKWPCQVSSEHCFLVTAPSYRQDIELEADLIEEVARLTGYDHLPTEPLTVPGCFLSHDSKNSLEQRWQNYLVHRGYQEVINLSFANLEREAQLVCDPSAVALINPLSQPEGVLRQTLIGHLLANLQYNLNRRQNRLKLFEIAHCFQQDSSGKIIETQKLAGLVYGPVEPVQWQQGQEAYASHQFFDLKGDLEAFFKHAEIQLDWLAAQHPAYHPGRCSAVQYLGQPIGFLGELHPSWLESYGLPKAPILFEISLDCLREKIKLGPTQMQATAIASTQPILRDLAFWVPAHYPAAQLLDALRTTDLSMRFTIAVFDVYVANSGDEKSIAIRIMLHPEHSLSDEAIANTLQHFIDAAQQVGARLRDS